MAMSGMRGLSVFISDIRNCQNKEQERLRVDKELGNIRTRFKNEKVCVFILGFFFRFFTSIHRFFFCLSLVVNLLFQT
jgi:hypothetical protein